MEDIVMSSIIKSLEEKDGKYFITYKKGTTAEIPSTVNGKPVPLLDPYDKEKGNGFMVQNSIMDSYLSDYAKLCYCALRRSIVYGTGFTFVNIESKNDGQRCLKQFMSVSKHTVQKALDELKYFGIIDIGRYRFKGSNKSIYCFNPESQWRLPDSKEAADHYREILNKEKQAKKKAKEEKTQGKKSEQFVFSYGKYQGKTMDDVYLVDQEFVHRQAEEAQTDLIRQEAIRVIDEMEQIPF